MRPSGNGSIIGGSSYRKVSIPRQKSIKRDETNNINIRQTRIDGNNLNKDYKEI